MTKSHFLEHRRLHDVQTLGNSKFTKDRCHLAMQKDGPHKHLFGLLLDADSQNPSTLEMMKMESVTFLLFT